MKHSLRLLFIAVLNLGILIPANAEVPWSFDNNTRYMVMGDSLSAGYGARPQTQGYAYLLYKQGAFDKSNNTLLSNAAVMGVTSTDVYSYQVPQALVFDPDVVTMTVGGNDLTPLFGVIHDPNFQLILYTTIETIANNVGSTLFELCNATPGRPVAIYVGNLYSVPLDTQLGLPSGSIDVIVEAVNQAIGDTVMAVNGYGLNCTVEVADINSAFSNQTGLLLIERHGASAFEIHPTNAGHRAIANAFEEAIN